MKIVVLNGSPHANGNTASMIGAFKKGAESAGHEVAVVQLGAMDIHDCLGCEYCHTKGEGKCIQQDDMEKVWEELDDAEMVVLASPVYFWGFSGKMQCTIARFYAQGMPKADKYAMLLSSGSPAVYGSIETQYKQFMYYAQKTHMGIFELAGEKAKDPFYLKEIEEFGASL